MTTTKTPTKEFWNGAETRTIMNTLHYLQEKIVEGLDDLYEAFYVAQEKIEENEGDSVHLRTPSFLPRGTTLAGYERKIS